MSDTAPLPVVFIPHGGGPCFFMDTPPPLPPDLWDRMAAYLRGIGAAIAPRPKAILVISGHWETQRPTVHTGTQHTLLFDYYGFPEHTYRLQYPAQGAPELAARVRSLLAKADIQSDEEPKRGLDHGVFVPLLLMYPGADIPIVQLSLRADRDPAAHIAIGAALAPLRRQGVLIVGSGMSYHNLRQFRNPHAGVAESAAFDGFLADAVTDPEPARRNAKLIAWDAAPGARASHPEEEHLLPLHVVAGAAGGDVGRVVYRDAILGKTVSGFQFG